MDLSIKQLYSIDILEYTKISMLNSHMSVPGLRVDTVRIKIRNREKIRFRIQSREKTWIQIRPSKKTLIRIRPNFALMKFIFLMNFIVESES